MKYAKFENIAYQFEPSPLVADSRVRFSELVSNNVKPTVYVANCRFGSNRFGHVFSSTSPTALLQDVCDYVGLI